MKYPLNSCIEQYAATRQEAAKDAPKIQAATQSPAFIVGFDLGGASGAG